jgi:hypothetical protein
MQEEKIKINIMHLKKLIRLALPMKGQGMHPFMEELHGFQKTATGVKVISATCLTGTSKNRRRCPG